jgi:hypothetical protein
MSIYMNEEVPQMNSLKERLEAGAGLLDRIARTREESRNAYFGENTESLLVAEHLRELEAEIARNPGALEDFIQGAPRG